MLNIDPVFAAPDFQITVSGGSAEENAQMATAIGHAMTICGFTQASIAPQSNTVPGYSGCEVLNSLRALNPDLFESCIQVSGAPQEQQFQMPMGIPDQTGNMWYNF